MYKIIAVLITFSLLTGCVSDSSEEQDERVLSIFKSSVFEVGNKNAVIVWDQAEDLHKETVKYTIILNSKEIASGLSGITYTLKNLKPRKFYKGFIKAEDYLGNKSIASFTFKTAGGEELAGIPL